MKILLTTISAIVFFASSSQATINGFISNISSGSGTYSVPAGKILVLQQVSYSPSETVANHFLNINGAAVYFTAATNGLYTLSKPLFLPTGTTITSPNALSISVFGVIIDTADAPLFVGVGSSLGNITVTGNSVTGELKLASTAPSTVLIQSSTNLLDWSYDSTIVMQPGADRTRMRFSVQMSGANRFYRALVRRDAEG